MPELANFATNGTEKIDELQNKDDFNKSNEKVVMIDLKSAKVYKCLQIGLKGTFNKPKIDFNSQEDFSPDNDVKRIAHKYWNWLMFPLSLK